MPGMSSSSKVWFDQFVANLEITTAAWCLIPALCTVSNSNSINRSLQRASLPVTSTRFSIQRSTWWSVRNLNLAPFEYGRNNRIAGTTARHLRCVVYRFLSCLLRVRDRYPLGRNVFLSTWSCRRNYPTYLSHALVSNVQCTFFFGKERISDGMSFSLRVAKAWSS